MGAAQPKNSILPQSEAVTIQGMPVQAAVNRKNHQLAGLNAWPYAHRAPSYLADPIKWPQISKPTVITSGYRRIHRFGALCCPCRRIPDGTLYK